MNRVPKDFRPYVKTAVKRGWRFEQRKRHAWLYAPDGVTTADGLLREFLARICWRCGFWWPEKPLDNDKTERTVW